MKIFTQLCLGLLFFCLFGTSHLYAQEKRIHSLEELQEVRKNRNKSWSHHHTNIRDDRPLIGIYTSHNDKGIEINNIVEGGGAAAAGLEAGDVITAINGNNLEDVRDLQTELSKYEGGQQVVVQYLRYGQARQANVTLKAKPVIKSNRPLIGIYPQSNGGKGIRVNDITASGGAVEGGIRSGDVITKINNAPINTETDLKAELSKYEAGDQVAVEYQRNGQAQQTQVTLKDRQRQTRSQERDPCEVFIGVSLSGSGPNGQGIHVNNVIDDTPAQIASVRDGDIIISFDDVRVNSFNELLHERNKHEPNDYFTLTVLREGINLDIEAQFKSCAQEEPNEEIMEEEEEVVQEIEAPQEIMIDNSLKVEQWKAYPNPAFGSLNVQFQAEALPTTVRLIDANGRTVYREMMNRFDGYYDQQIDLSDITPGNYYLQVRQADKVITEKIVVIPKA